MASLHVHRAAATLGPLAGTFFPAGASAGAKANLSPARARRRPLYQVWTFRSPRRCPATATPPATFREAQVMPLQLGWTRCGIGGDLVCGLGACGAGQPSAIPAGALALHNRSVRRCSRLVTAAFAWLQPAQTLLRRWRRTWVAKNDRLVAIWASLN